MTATNTPALTVGSVTIRAHSGMYSLNDLHRASGSDAKHQPANFVRLDTTQALIQELCSSDVRNKPVEIVRGRGKAQGTYACRELVIAYAAWISSEFHLKVIRVFLDTVAPAAPAPVPQQLEINMAQTLNDTGITQDMIADIVASTTQNLVQTLQQKRKLIHWQEVIEALQNPNTDMQFADLTGIAHACLARLQRNIDAEAFRVIERRASNRNQSTADVSLHA